MFCTHCGQKGGGNFCAHCGTKMDGAAELPSGDWQQEIHYHTLLCYPEVRQRIANSAAQAKKGLSGEEFLELCDNVYKPLVGVSLSTMANIIVPIYAKLGVQTGKARSITLSLPCGEAIVRVLCSLASRRRELKNVEQAEDGCVIQATLPSDIWAWAGEIIVCLHRQPTGVLIDASIKIPGQWYDWGKSATAMQQLCDDVAQLPPVLKVA